MLIIGKVKEFTPFHGNRLCLAIFSAMMKIVGFEKVLAGRAFVSCRQRHVVTFFYSGRTSSELMNWSSETRKRINNWTVV